MGLSLSPFLTDSIRAAAEDGLPMGGNPDREATTGEDEEAFAIRITDSAREINDAAAEYAAQYGAVVTFDSRSAAADLATLFSRTDGSTVAVQAAAPQDDSKVDAYLVARPDRRTHEPTGSVDTALTFDTTANQFGALGEMLVLCYDANPPLLAHYVRADLEVALDEPLHVDVDPDPAPVTVSSGDSGETHTWVPDCRAVARPEPGGRPMREYLCEIKTGGGSLERDQLAVMQAVSRRTPVLKIQLDIGDLPDSYTARVRRVTAADADGLGDGTLGGDVAPNARLDEFS